MEKEKRASKIRIRHADLISGLIQVYQTLVDLDRIKAEDIIYPPYHNQGHQISAEVLRSYGYDQETVLLIQELPYLSDELVWNGIGRSIIAPEFTAATNYFCDPSNGLPYIDTSYQHPRRDGFMIDAGERDLEPQMLRLTTDGLRGFAGIHYIYNSQNCRMVQWDTAKRREGDRSQIYWYDEESAWLPVSEVLGEWNQKMRSLQWLAIPDVGFFPPAEEIEEYNVEKWPDYGDRDYTAEIQTVKDYINYHRAAQQVYRRNGWPDLRKEEFRVDAKEFARQVEEVSSTAKHSEWIRQAAGEDAV